MAGLISALLSLNKKKEEEKKKILASLAAYMNPESNAGKNFWSTPAAQGMARLQEIPNPIATTIDVIKGALGESQAGIQRAGGQNYEPIPTARYTPQNFNQQIGAKIPGMVGDVVSWQNSGINQSFDQGGRLLSTTARLNPYLGPKIMQAEDTLANLSRKSQQVIDETLNTNIELQNRPGFARIPGWEKRGASPLQLRKPQI